MQCKKTNKKANKNILSFSFLADTTQNRTSEKNRTVNRLTRRPPPSIFLVFSECPNAMRINHAFLLGFGIWKLEDCSVSEPAVHWDVWQGLHTAPRNDHFWHGELLFPSPRRRWQIHPGDLIFLSFFLLFFCFELNWTYCSWFTHQHQFILAVDDDSRKMWMKCWK